MVSSSDSQASDKKSNLMQYKAVTRSVLELTTIIVDTVDAVDATARCCGSSRVVVAVVDQAFDSASDDAVRVHYGICRHHPHMQPQTAGQ